MDISIVILTWNSSKHIERCLTSLLTTLQESSFSFEIFVVDNGSTDETAQILNRFGSCIDGRIMPIFLNKNMGTTYSRNLALRKAKGNFIVILDSDVEVPLATIPQLLKVLKERRDIGLVTPKLIYPDGRLQKSTDKFPTLPSKMIRYLFLKQIEKKESRSQTKNYPVEPDYAISALWVFRREVLDNVGLLDERIFYAPEDVDYCLRVWKKGYKVHYDPACFAIHHTQEISRGLKVNRLTIDHIKGLVYYFRKHKYLFRRPKRPIITFSSCR